MSTRLVLIAAAITALAACNRSSAGGPPGMQFPPAAVELATARATPLEDATEYVATLRSFHSTNIQPQTDGQITRIFVHSGERVANGAPLVEIDPRRQRAAVNSQEAERAAREAAVTYARQQEERSQQLFAAGAISRQELEQAQTALTTAKADLASLEAQVQQQEVQLRYYTVTAPTAGIVGDIPVRVGLQVTTATLLTTVDQNETLELYVNVPMERAGSLKEGLPIRVLSSDGEQVLAETSIYFISPHVDDQTQSVLVKAHVPNPKLTLRNQQFVRARLIWRQTEAITVPVTAVLRINGQYFLFVAEHKGQQLVARQRPVKLGEITGNDYPVLSGVKAGEQIVVSDVQRLADGAPIQPAPPGAAPGAHPGGPAKGGEPSARASAPESPLFNLRTVVVS